MRSGYQKGSIKQFRGKWVAQWWEGEVRRNRVLGKATKMTKAQARKMLATIVADVNDCQHHHLRNCTVGVFVNQVFLPFYKRKWKASTVMTNLDRLKNHVVAELGDRRLRDVTRDELQSLLEAKARVGFSYSVVAHLRWDFKQIFDLAFAEGHLEKNPAKLLFIPKQAPRAKHPVMTFDDVRKLFGVLDLRERLIVQLALLAGMRPGEIFGLKWCRLQNKCFEIRQRLYKGQIDTPKTHNSIRDVALPDGLMETIEEWKQVCPDISPDGWVFPSENLRTPLRRDNCWRRHIRPRLEKVGLEWTTFQVMRRTHSTLMCFLKVDPKVVADQLGHSLDVNQNVYTQVLVERRLEAVNELESALGKSVNGVQMEYAI